MASINEEARIPVYLNDEQAKSALKNLQGQAERWKNIMQDAMVAGDMKGVKNAEKNLKRVTNQANKLKRETFDVNKVLNNMSDASTDDLRKALRAVNKEMKGLKRSSDVYKDLDRKAKSLKREIRGVNTDLKKQKGLFSGMGGIKDLLPIASVGALAFTAKQAVGELFNLAKVMEADAIRSSQVFGENLGYVTEQAEDLAAKMGLTTREFVAAATATGDLLIPLDFTREQAAEMSVELQGLSGALDEWTGGQYGAAEVSNILTKAMLGENEQLKQLGIAVRQDSEEFRNLVAQKIQAENVTKAQARALATLELIQKKSTDAQAAYNSEGNKLLRLQKSITAWWGNMKEGFVEYFQDTESDKIEFQRKEVNNLTVALYEHNLTSEEREKIMKRLKVLAPDIVESVTAEGIATDKTRIALEKYNKEAIKRAFIASKQEELESLFKKQGDMMSNYYTQISKVRNRINEMISSNEGGMGAVIQKIQESGKSVVEQAKAINELEGVSINTLQTMSGGGYATTSGENYMANIAYVQGQRDKFRQEISLLQDEIAEAEKWFNEQEGLNVDNGEDNPTIDGGGSDTPEGTRKTIGNIVYEWDGKTWKKVEMLEAEPFDFSDVDKAFKKSLAEMDSVLDTQMDEFSDKWSEYRDIQKKYIPIDQDVHTIALEKLKKLYDEQIISYEEYHQAKDAIDERIAIQDEERRLERREMENELEMMNKEKDALKFQEKISLEEERFNQEMELLKQRFELEQKAHKDNKDELLKAELDYKKKVDSVEQNHAENKKRIVQEEMDIQMGRLQVAEDVLGGLASVAGQESQLGKAALIFKQAIAVAEASMALGLGMANTAKVGFPQNIPLIAGFIAQTAGLINSIKSVVAPDDSGVQTASKQQSKGRGYKSGGYTDSYLSDDKVVGDVHANEFVATAETVRNPTVKPYLDIIDIAQRTGKVASLDLTSRIAPPARQRSVNDAFAGGGGEPQPVIVQQNVPEEVTTLIRETREELTRLRTEGVQGVWDYDYHKKSLKKMSDIEKDVGT